MARPVSRAISATHRATIGRESGASALSSLSHPLSRAHIPYPARHSNNIFAASRFAIRELANFDLGYPEFASPSGLPGGEASVRHDGRRRSA
jgi:hypothetical protein